MLKIKDNVNLKELEKYGFKKIKTYGDWNSYWENEEYRKCDLSVNVSKFFKNKIETVIPEEDLDTLFELIKANLVEKINE